MRNSFLTLAIILSCCALFAQNENPYAQFGYQAAIMPEQSKPKMEHQVDRLYIINQDSTDAVAIVALDAINRNITFYDKNRQILKVDTLTNYTLARWISPDPYGQFSSPYLSMGNNPINGVDPDGGWLSPFNFTGAAVGLAVGAGIGLAVDKDNWGWYALGGAAAGGFLSSDLAKVNIWHSHGYNGLVAAKNGREGIRLTPRYVKSTFTTYKDVAWQSWQWPKPIAAIANGLKPNAKHTVEVELGGTGRLVIRNSDGKSANPKEINPRSQHNSGRMAGILDPSQFYSSELPSGSTGVKVTLAQPLASDGSPTMGLAYIGLGHQEISDLIKIRVKSIHTKFRRKRFF
jgi:hypothetical protein